jgi:hypothetical protein
VFFRLGRDRPGTADSRGAERVASNLESAVRQVPDIARRRDRVGAQVEAVVASAGVSRDLGNSGLEGPPTHTLSPPGAGVGVMVGATSELELTGVVTGPKTPEEADAMLRSLN